MKFVFLDIDGVLNDNASMEKKRELYLVEELLIRRLNTICEVPGVVCVVSSTWRRRWPVPALQMFLDKHGFTGRIVDRTPWFPNEERGVEIAAYIEECKQCGLQPESWVILDDDEDMGPLAIFHVHTDGDIGLTNEDVDKAIAILTVGGR